MPVSGCCIHQLWAVINSWPPLRLLMPSEEEGQPLYPLESQTYITRLPLHLGSSCSRSDGKCMGMSQCRIRTKNVIHGHLSNVHVGMCWAVDVHGFVAACEGSLHKCELMPRKQMWLANSQAWSHGRCPQKQTRCIVNKHHSSPALLLNISELQ